MTAPATHHEEVTTREIAFQDLVQVGIQVLLRDHLYDFAQIVVADCERRAAAVKFKPAA